jgi:hypothetical protein
MNTTNLSPSHPYINLTTFRKNGQDFIPMRARFVQDEDLLRRADALYKRKYGFQRTLINWLNRLRGRQDTPVLIELTSEQA